MLQYLIHCQNMSIGTRGGSRIAEGWGGGGGGGGVQGYRVILCEVRKYF